MVFSFTLPTTSHLSIQSFILSNTHPSLPQCASTARHAVRTALKKHKSLSPEQRPSHLPYIHTALEEYIPYLLPISHGLGSDSKFSSCSREQSGSGGEEIDILLRSEIESEWRPTLSSQSVLRLLRQGASKGRSGLSSTTSSSSLSRVKCRGLDFEIGFVLTTLAYVLSSLARTRYLTTLYANKTPSPEQKTAAIQAAIKNLLLANSVHSYLATIPPPPTSTTFTPSDGSGSTHPVQIQVPIPDLDPSTQSGLSSLALAEATLLAVLKDDAYISACIQSRNTHDNEWMVKPPDIPKVRALLFARLCVRAAEYAEQAVASAGSVQKGSCGSGGGPDMERKVNEDLLGYMRVLAKVARAKACRFFAIDAEMAGKVGEAIAWLRAGRAALGFKSSLAGDNGADSGGGGKGKLSGGFSRLKREWSERKEERKVEKESSSFSRPGERETDIDFGDDAGREEEARVIDMLETKWMKMNDTVSSLSGTFW